MTTPSLRKPLDSGARPCWPIAFEVHPQAHPQAAEAVVSVQPDERQRGDLAPTLWAFVCPPVGRALRSAAPGQISNKLDHVRHVENVITTAERRERESA